MPTLEPFCAICTEPPPPQTILIPRPLGKRGALVLVCVDCDTLHPRSGRYSFAEGSHSGGRAGPGRNLGDGNHRTRIR